MRAAVVHPLLALAVAGGGVAVAVVVTLLVRGSERSVCRAALIPAYVPPEELRALAAGVGRGQMVIVNPASGPGAAADPGYAHAVRSLQGAGARVLGYVPTGHGTRPAADVVADVGRWVTWYRVDGIFFDEVAATDDYLEYYRTLSDQTRSDHRSVVFNPGMPPARSYFELADVVVTFEGPYAGYERALETAPAWLRSEPRERIGHLVYSATRTEALDAVGRAVAGFVYATSGGLPNPWRSLPLYLGDEEKALAACR